MLGIMKEKIKVIFITIFIIISIILLITNLPFFNVENTIVTGNVKVTSEEVEATVLSQDKNNIFLMSNNQTEKLVEKIPYVKNAEVSKVLPNSLKIEITEREPIAYLVYNKDSYIYIDDGGYVLEVNKEPLLDRPFVTGTKYGNFVLNEPLTFENEYTLQKISIINSNMEKYYLQDYQITIDLSEDYNVKLKVNDITVGLGEFENIDKKMRYLKSILAELDEKGYMSGYIDLSDFDKPITFKFDGNN